MGKVKDAGKIKRNLLLYLIAAGILIGLISIIGLIKFTELPLGIFIAAMAWLLIVGTLHAWFFDKIIILEHGKSGKILFTMAICFFGLGLVLLSFKIFFHSPFPTIYFLPAFFFIAPVFVMIAFSYFVKIPMKVYKAWVFPVPGSLSDPNDSEMADPIIVNLEISKKNSDSRTVFKAKAPKAMELGRLFYFFIMDYNSRHPDNPILTDDNDHKPYRWSFSVTPSIIKGKIHLDPEINISDNRIKENASVICERVIS